MGCGGAGDEETVPVPVDDVCGPGALALHGCGLACKAGELAGDDGVCLPAGVPPDRCAAGFEPAEGGCNAVLPATKCPPGQIAVPGETVCREVAPCGAGSWGDIPVEPSTVYVDAAFGGAGNGSAAQPFTQIGDAIAAAGPGAIVAIAEGTYVENLVVAGKAVRLWGRCPALVEIRGAGGVGAVLIREGAAGTEVRDLAVSGPTIGLVASGATDVVFERVLVHGTGGRGIDIETTFGPVSATVRGSLVEGAAENGIFVLGAPVTIEASLIRDTVVTMGGARGINVQIGPAAPADVRLVGSVVEGVPDEAVRVWGSRLSVEASVIRDGVPLPDGTFGRGIDAYSDGAAGRASVTVTGSVIERVLSEGIAVTDTDFVMEATTVRDVLPEQQSSLYGRCTSMTGADPVLGRPTAAVRWSLFERCVGGLLVSGGIDAVVEGLWVRDVVNAGESGRGVLAQDEIQTGLAPTLLLRGSVVERAAEVGAVTIGGPATFEAVRIADTASAGIAVQSGVNRASGTLRAVLVERASGAGIHILGADATIDDTAVYDITPLDAFMAPIARGINVQLSIVTGLQSNATVTRTLVEHARELGMTVFASQGIIRDSIVRNIEALPGDILGDGYAVQAAVNLETGETYAGAMELERVMVDGAARAGVSAFSSAVVISGSTIHCAAFPLDGEQLPMADRNATFDDRGGNTCGCGEETVECKVLGASLTPPGAVVEE
jgi:hypothetical protein